MLEWPFAIAHRAPRGRTPVLRCMTWSEAMSPGTLSRLSARPGYGGYRPQPGPLPAHRTLQIRNDLGLPDSKGIRARLEHGSPPD
jgi:hypothetical protein